MARDMLHYAARIVLATGGPSSGHTSFEFHFQWSTTGTPATSDWNQLATDVAGFLVTLPPSGTHMCGYYLGPQVSRTANASEVAVYALDMADAAHYYGTPVTVGTFTVPAGSASPVPLPNEIACCLSYRADYGADPEHGGSTRPRADDRGRIYFGPLEVNAINNTTLPSGQKVANVQASLASDLSKALTMLANAVFAHNWKLMVWSRQRQQMKEVISKAVDPIDFDIQRRRGNAVGLLAWVPL